MNIARTCSFLNNEKLSSNEQKYMRSVLERTSGCVLYDSTNVWIRQVIGKQPVTIIEDNEIVSKLISTVNKIKKYNPINYALMNRELLKPINDECLEKYNGWPINTQLYALDILYSINRAKEIPFFEILLSSFLTRFTELKTGPALQVMYYVACSKRQFRSNEESHRVIKQLETCINELQLDEVAIYCLAFIKSETHVESLNLIKSLYNCLLDRDLREYDDIGVTAVVKAVRRFSTAVHLHDLKRLQQQLVPYAKTASQMSLTHIIQLGAKQRVFNRQLIEVVLQRFLNNFNTLRIKDVERALLTLSVFNDNKKNAIEMEFLKTSHRYLQQSLNSNFVESIFRCISHLIVLRAIDMQLINWALDPKTHSYAFGESIYHEEFGLLLIDSYAKINLENTYTGYKLPVELCATLMPRIAEKDVTGRQSEVMMEICDILRNNGIDYVQCHMTPYVAFPETFLVYNRRTNKTVHCIDRCNLPGTILKASDLHRNHPDLEAVAIILCLQRQTVFESNRYSGLFQFKLDQLKLLGFKVIVIKRFTWTQYRGDAAKRRYLTVELCKNNIFLLNRSKFNVQI